MFSRKKPISVEEKKIANNLASSITEENFFGQNNEEISTIKQQEPSQKLEEQEKKLEAPKLELSHTNKQAIFKKLQQINTLNLTQLKDLNNEIKEKKSKFGFNILKQQKKNENYVKKKIEDKKLVNKLKNINKLNLNELKKLNKSLKETSILNNLLYPRNVVERAIEKKEKDMEDNKIKSNKNELKKLKEEADEKSKTYGSWFKSTLKSSAESVARVTAKAVKGSYEGYNKSINKINKDNISTRIKKIQKKNEKNNTNIETIKKNIRNTKERDNLQKVLSQLDFISINSCPDSISDGYKSINTFNTEITENIEQILLNIKKYKKLENRNIELNKYLIDELNIIYEKKSHLDDPVKYYIQDKQGDKRYMNAGIKNSTEKIKKAKSFVNNFIKQIFLNLEKILLIKKDIVNRVLYIKKLYNSNSDLIISNYLKMVTNNYNETKNNADIIVDKYNSINIDNGIKKETENSLKTNKQKFLEEMKNKGCKKNNKEQSSIVTSNSVPSKINTSSTVSVSSNSEKSTVSMTTSNPGKSTDSMSNVSSTTSVNPKTFSYFNRSTWGQRSKKTANKE